MLSWPAQIQTSRYFEPKSIYTLKLVLQSHYDRLLRAIFHFPGEFETVEWHHISQRSYVGSKLNEPELHFISAGFLFSGANSQLRLYASNGAKRTDGDELHSCNGHPCLYRDRKILKVMIPATYVRNLQPLGLQHRVSWRYPRSNHWHQLDLILARRSCLPSVQITRS